MIYLNISYLYVYYLVMSIISPEIRVVSFIIVGAFLFILAITYCHRQTLFLPIIGKKTCRKNALMN